MPPTEGGVGLGLIIQECQVSKDPILTLHQVSLVAGELTERQGSYNPRIFLLAVNNWSHCMVQSYTGAPRYKRGAGADNACSELYNKARASVPEVDNIWKATSGSRHPRDSRKPFTLRLSGLLFLGPLSWASKSLPFWTVGEGRAGGWLSLAGGEEEGREQFFRTPAEVGYGRQRVQEDRKGRFLGAGWGLLPFPPLSY